MQQTRLYHITAWFIAIVLLILPFVLNKSALEIFGAVSGGLAASAAIIAAVFAWHVPEGGPPVSWWRSAEYWSTTAGVWGASAVAVIVANLIKSWPS